MLMIRQINGCGRGPRQPAKRKVACGAIAARRGGVKFVRNVSRAAPRLRRRSVARSAGIISSEPWEARQAAPSGGGGGRCAARDPRMLRLHYFSDNPALVAGDEEESVYSIDLIKEFEAVGRAWKAFLADGLLKGAGFVYVTHAICCYLLLLLFLCYALRNGQ